MARMKTMPIILAPLVSSVEETSSLIGYVNSTAASVVAGVSEAYWVSNSGRDVPSETGASAVLKKPTTEHSTPTRTGREGRSARANSA